MDWESPNLFGVLSYKVLSFSLLYAYLIGTLETGGHD